MRTQPDDNICTDIFFHIIIPFFLLVAIFCSFFVMFYLAGLAGDSCILLAGLVCLIAAWLYARCSEKKVEDESSSSLFAWAGGRSATRLYIASSSGEQDTCSTRGDGWSI